MEVLIFNAFENGFIFERNGELRCYSQRFFNY